MLSSAAHFIPIGCIGISRNEAEIDHDLWGSIIRQSWSKFVWDDGTPAAREMTNGYEPCLESSVQASLLNLPKLMTFTRLFRARWARLAFGISPLDDQLGIIRVHLLPDDSQRRTVDRSDAGLRKDRRFLLQVLDYSMEAWQGRRIPKETGEAVPFDVETSLDPGKTCDVNSLLQLFNVIPSPNPRPETVVEPYTQDAMHSLLESNVDGLVTTLYPYQRRSAALMLQKEVQPGQVLDPRLLHLRDAEGSPWYLDPVAGVVLLEPRHYDGVSGGILAEEMGAGKTIICLSLILASRHLPTKPPEVYRAHQAPTRGRLASLVDMAASCATRHAVAWKPYFEACKSRCGYEFQQCEEALVRNRGYYLLPPPEVRRGRYQSCQRDLAPQKVFLSSATLVIVPNNLVAQWRQEMQKHTRDLNTLILTGKDCIPPVHDVLDRDIILFSQSCFERMAKKGGGPLSSLHFKRCIVDEGHKLGNSRMGSKSNLLIGLDALRISSRWVVTGTPSRGLFGVDGHKTGPAAVNGKESASRFPAEVGTGINESSTELERKDLERIGAIAALYLKARPWANTMTEAEDTPADWSTYLMLPKQNRKTRGRRDCLRLTLNSLIVRHRLAEVGDLLPPVDERVVVLDGSYQDQLSLNLFSMMIVFNSVQSQRRDMDYFFHQRQRRALLQIVHNLKQASFFGGSFFTVEEIATSVKTAEAFLQERKVPVSAEDEVLLRAAIRFGHVAVRNRLKAMGNRFHEMAVCVSGFPGAAGQSWSLDGGCDGDTICTSTSMLLAAQKLIYKTAEREGDLNSLLNGGLIREGMLERQKVLAEASSDGSGEEGKAKRQKKMMAMKDKRGETDGLAGNTKLGSDEHKRLRSHGMGVKLDQHVMAEKLSGPLGLTMIRATVSAKLTYLVDNIVRYQEREKMIVFYENENVAWYLASMLDVLQIQYLIYAKNLTAERKAQYVKTFHQNQQFSVLLMDLSQAAFGLDMRGASRIYFINPVLNPQVEAQAIGRVRRISQNRPVTVETLVLRGSIDEIMLERRRRMTQAEHRQVKSILDIRPIFDWIRNARVTPMCDDDDDDDGDGGDYRSQMVDLETPQPVFGRGFGRTLQPDEGIVLREDGDDQHSSSQRDPAQEGDISAPLMIMNGVAKRSLEDGPGVAGEVPSRPARRVRFMDG